MSLFFSVGRRCSLGRLIPLLEPAAQIFSRTALIISEDSSHSLPIIFPFSSHYLPILLLSSSHHPPIILPTSSQHPPNILPTTSQLSSHTIPKESRKNPERCDEKGRDMVLLCDILWSVVQRDMVVRFQGDKNLQLKGCLVVCPCTCERT